MIKACFGGEWRRTTQDAPLRLARGTFWYCMQDFVYASTGLVH